MVLREAASRLREMSPPPELPFEDAVRHHAATRELVEELERRGGRPQVIHLEGQMELLLNDR